MGFNHLQLVKKFWIGLLFLSFLVLGACQNESKVAVVDRNYKPAVKVAGVVYGVTEVDFSPDVALEELDYLGEVAYVHEEGLSVPVEEGDPDFTSNSCPKGTKLYRYGETEILVEYIGEGYSLFEPI